jgi:RNA polymerase sigma-70 factor (ECF subfamily)
MDDKSRIEKARSGDLQAIRLLVEENKNLVWHIIISILGSRQEGEDLFQEVFLRVFKGLKKFRSDARISTWIGSIAHNVCVDHIRNRKREEGFRAGAHDRDKGSSLTLDMSYKKTENDDLKQLVLDMITKLPADYRTVITLYHLDDQSYSDIVAITGMPEGTVKSYISRARNRLREMLVSAVPDFQELMQDL